MYSTCFEPEGSSSGRWMFIVFWYGMVCISVSNQVGRKVCLIFNTFAYHFFEHTLLPTRLLILMHVTHTIP